MHAESPPPPTAVASPPSATGRSTPRRWRQLGLLSAAMGTDSGEQSAVSVMFPAMRTALGLPLSALSLLVAVGRLAGVVFGPLWVGLAQRFPRKYVLAVCSGLWGLWTIATGFAQNHGQLLVLFGVAAAGLAGAGPLINGILADLFDDRTRGRAAGVLFGSVALFTALLGPLLGHLSQLDDGWRYGFFILGGLQLLSGLALLLFFEDPGVGAAEPQLASLDAGSRKPRSRAFDRASLRRLAGIRSFPLMCLQRLLSAQFVMVAFGVVFLVDARGFGNSEASLVVFPAALSYLLGTLAGGVLADRVQRRFPRSGRIAVLQAAFLAYGAIAYVATQIAWSHLGIYAFLFSLLGALQGVQPGVNRPVVMAITPPELRSAAFAVFIGIEGVGWAAITLAVGYLGDGIGLQDAFLWVVVVVVLVGGLLATPLYRTYARDVAALQAELDRRAADNRPLPNDVQS
ncbi:MFS transporter [Kitasatospora sp. SUK 42]|uniref:MFS transporter n=1 Tax=Kitasatospora sp. SUK 42 TaxID=1588882 RepID=UPI0018CBE94A|nr:MFS transporter [Kitasatospora sp. SUK 42]MBV2155141.1 MFS transporter [Kitasatospora sp. SUK 42]